MKITIQIDIVVDIKKIFSEIPEGLFADEPNNIDDTEKEEREFLIDSIHTVLRNAHINILQKEMKSIINSEKYKFEKHFLETEKLIGEQLKNFKIISQQ